MTPTCDGRRGMNRTSLRRSLIITSCRSLVSFSKKNLRNSAESSTKHDQMTWKKNLIDLIYYFFLQRCSFKFLYNIIFLKTVLHCTADNNIIIQFMILWYLVYITHIYISVKFYQFTVSYCCTVIIPVVQLHKQLYHQQ